MMIKPWRIALPAIVALGFAAFAAAQAEENPPASASQGSMMGHGTMQGDGMSGMMEQMTQMMATCNQMMQGMMHHGPGQMPEPPKKDG